MADKSDKSKLETKTEVILEFNKSDFYDRVEGVKGKNKGKLELVKYDVTPLKDGRTMCYVMIRYQI